MRLSCAAALAAAVMLGPGAPAAWAVDEPEVVRLRAERLARDGRCTEAVALLDRVSNAGPESAAQLHLRGRCAFDAQQWAEAAAAFESARRADASLPEIDLELGIARYHQGDMTGAAAALVDARGRTRQLATLDLYQGLVDLARDQHRAAAARLDAARARDPLAVEPIASYYAGLAWAQADEREKAREAFARVQSEAPNSPYAKAAAEALAQQAAGGSRGLADRRDLQGVQQASRPLGAMAEGGHERWLAVSVGVEYDDNVVLRGSDVELPRDISDEGDERLVWTAEAGAELLRSENWAAGLVAAYYGSAHEDLEQFNVHYPTITGWLDRRLDEATTLRLQYDFGYAWVDTDPYLLNHSFTPAIFHDWGEGGTTRFFVELDYNNFLFGLDDVPDGTGAGLPCGGPSFCGPAGLDEGDYRNRDGFGIVAGADHGVPLNDRVSLRSGYRYHRYNARGREYTYQAHEARLGVRGDLGADFVLDVQGRYTYRPYRHASSFPDPRPADGTQYALSGNDRREKTVQADVILERPITDWLVGSLRYSYVDNDSNVEVFDYDRHVVGGYLTVRFQSGDPLSN